MIKRLIQQIIDFFTGRKFKKVTIRKEYPEYHVTAFDMKVFWEINEYRMSKGLPYLEFKGGDLLNITASYPKWLMDNEIGVDKHSFFDERSDQIILRYPYITKVSENAGFGYVEPKSVVDAWARSDGHRKTMEGDFKYIAVASCGKHTNSIYIK